MIITDQPEVNPNLRVEDINTTFGQAVGASAWSAIYNSPTMQLQRTYEDYKATGPKIDYETARARAQAEGVSIQIDPAGINEGALNLLIERKKAISKANDTISRGPKGVAAGAGYFVAGLGASLIDPLNIASAYIPIARAIGMNTTVARAGVLGAEGAAATALGRFSARSKVGAVEGAVGQAILEPLTYYRARQEQEDYTITNTLLNVGFGGVLGATAHTGIGALGDKAVASARRAEAARLIEDAKTAQSAAARIQKAGMETNAAVFRAEVAAAADGRKVDTAPLMEGVEAKEADLGDLDFTKMFGPKEVPRISTEAAWAAKDFDRNVNPSSTDLPALKASIEKNGFDESKPITITVNTAEGVGYVTDGNNRLAAAKALGLPDVPYKVELTDVPFTAEQRAKAQPVDKLGLKPGDLAPKAKSAEALEAEAWLREQTAPKIDADRVTAATEASLRPENDVHYDGKAKAEVDEAVAKMGEMDPEQAVLRATQEAQAELAALSKQLGIDPEKNAAMRSADETAQLASKYSRAVEALASCQART